MFNQICRLVYLLFDQIVPNLNPSLNSALLHVDALFCGRTYLSTMGVHVPFSLLNDFIIMYLRCGRTDLHNQVPRRTYLLPLPKKYLLNLCLLLGDLPFCLFCKALNLH